MVVHCLANFPLNGEDCRLSQGHIFLDFHCLQALDPEKQTLYENMCLSRYVNL